MPRFDEWKNKYLTIMGSQIISKANKPKTFRASKGLRAFAHNLNKSKPYSESWFRRILLDNKLKSFKSKQHFRHNYPYKMFIIDFAYVEDRVGIEIQDKSHNDSRIKIKDELKRQFLENEGWTMFYVDHGNMEQAQVVIDYLKHHKNKMDWRTLRSLTK